ncbi:hypothetical protein QPL79_08325 [Ignisphaera sp. 4213-co]|uniref:DUF4352 domain-containing protein n=1 Tax=Ignisphaera cupida TaxID=3050454 RepID=A0ABD4Z7Q2_9CREN|nr:hypothetical protein [Ignisphaera sp. 4213-co]MDK6029366.1 hypothetical protein [Ignisphaera sp. 4213-co]
MQKRIVEICIVVAIVAIFIAIAFHNKIHDLVASPQPQLIRGAPNTSITVGDWVINLRSITIVTYEICKACVVESVEDMNIVIAKLEIHNNDTITKSMSEIWGFELVTNTEKKYRCTSTSAPPTIKPKDVAEYYITFSIPASEKPSKLILKISNKFIVEIML